MSIWNKMLASLTHTRVLCIFTIYNGDDGSSTIIFIEPRLRWTSLHRRYLSVTATTIVTLNFVFVFDSMQDHDLILLLDYC